jgi:hypothetical protein
MSRRSNFRLLLKSSVFLLAVLAIARIFLAKKKKFFNYKINNQLLKYYLQPNFDKIVFTYTELVAGDDAFYSLEANVYDTAGDRMNSAPIKVPKHGISKTLKNATPDYRDITLTLDSQTIATHGVDITGDYILSASQICYDGDLFVSYIFDVNEHISNIARRFARSAQQFSGTTEHLMAAAQTSFSAFKINPSPPY